MPPVLRLGPHYTPRTDPYAQLDDGTESKQWEEDFLKDETVSFTYSESTGLMS
jgi:hypothetical protein